MKIYWKVFWILLVLLGALIFPRLVLGANDLQGWVAYLNSPESQDAWATELGVDDTRNVYVTGTSGQQIVVLKYDSTRNHSGFRPNPFRETTVDNG